MLARVSAEGFVDAEGKIELDLDVVAVGGSLGLVFDPPRETFGGQFSVESCVPSDFCPVGFDAVLTSRGVGGCVGGDLLSVAQVIPRGFGYKWGDPLPGGVDVIFGDCDLEPYRVELRPSRRRPATASGSCAGRGLSPSR